MAESEPSISAKGLGQALSAAGKSLTSTGSDESGAPSAAASEVKAIANDMAEIRSHLRRTAAVLGAAASTILLGLGYAQVHEAFPLPAGRVDLTPPQWPFLLAGALVAGVVMSRVMALSTRLRGWRVEAGLAVFVLIFLVGWWNGWFEGEVSIAGHSSRFLTVGLAVSSLLAVGGAAWLTSRFFGAQRRILIATDDSLTKLADAPERRARAHFFDEIAAEASAHSLQALELRARRFERISMAPPATQADSTDVESLKSQAEYLLELVALAQYRAALWILEYRSKKAFDGWPTKLALAMAVVGLVGVFGIADYAKGERALVDLREKCQKAFDAGTVDACDSVRSAQNKADAAARLTKQKADEDKALDDAKKLLESNSPRDTPIAKADFLDACVLVLLDEASLKTEPDLSAKCLSLIPPG